jgi:hypothetical protein
MINDKNYKPKNCSDCKYLKIVDDTYCASDWPSFTFSCSKSNINLGEPNKQGFDYLPEGVHKDCPLSREK